MGERHQHLYEFGPFRLIPEESLLLREGRPVALAPKDFEEFFGFWKDADPDIPILLEAKREYARLR